MAQSPMALAMPADSGTEGMRHPSGHAEAFAAGFSGQCVAAPARTDGRRPDGRFAAGNQCSRQHGKRSSAAIERRKTGAAGRKVAGLILAQLGALPGYRHRPRPLRRDQAELLALVDSAGLAAAASLGLALGPAA